MSNEKIIREFVREWLLSEHKDSVVKDEFGVFLSVRNDLMCVSSTEIISVEIKSDRDNFNRLESQLTGYDSFSSSIYVALDIKHYEKYIELYQSKFSHVGIIVFDGNEIEVKSEAKKKKLPNLLFLLTSSEITIFLKYFKGRSKLPKNYNSISILVNDLFSHDEIYNISKEIFFKRFRGYRENDAKYKIINIEEKQIKFNEWLLEKNWKMYKGKRDYLLKM